MNIITWIFKWLAWPFVLCVKLKKDHGEHEFVLPGLEAIFGLTLLVVVVSSLFLHDPSSIKLNRLIPLFLLIIYLLIGLFLCFDSKSDNSKKPGG